MTYMRSWKSLRLTSHTPLKVVRNFPQYHTKYLVSILVKFLILYLKKPEYWIKSVKKEQNSIIYEKIPFTGRFFLNTGV
jgi:hypothetical protein